MKFWIIQIIVIYRVVFFHVYVICMNVLIIIIIIMIIKYIKFYSQLDMFSYVIISCKCDLNLLNTNNQSNGQFFISCFQIELCNFQSFHTMSDLIKCI